MDSHLENSDDDVTLSPDLVDSEQSLSDDSPETLDVDDDLYTVPEVCVNVDDMADASDSSVWVDAKSDDDDDGNLICPSPINSYSVYSYRPWGYKWGEPWPAFDTIRPWNSCSPVWYEEKPSLVVCFLDCICVMHVCLASLFSEYLFRFLCECVFKCMIFAGCWAVEFGKYLLS